jgi:hypothetical protein
MNKILSLVVMLFSFQHFTFSHDKQLVDSLQAFLETTVHDTNRVIILNRLSRAYLGNNPGKAIDYAEQSLALSKQIDYKKGIGSSYNSIGNVFYIRPDFPEALK